MNKLRKIFFIAILVTFAGLTCFAQVGSINADSARLTQKKPGSAANAKGQNSNGLNKRQGNSQNTGGSLDIKQVKGARPDMSKARGARPPYIVRPSGSGIPRGMGKPGGVGRRGGR